MAIPPTDEEAALEDALLAWTEERPDLFARALRTLSGRAMGWVRAALAVDDSVAAEKLQKLADELHDMADAFEKTWKRGRRR
jgi:hypothetical protein